MSDYTIIILQGQKTAYRIDIDEHLNSAGKRLVWRMGARQGKVKADAVADVLDVSSAVLGDVSGVPR